MNKLIIKNKTVVTVTRYVEINGFEYTVDHLKRVRYVGVIDGAHKDISREERRKLQESTVTHIRANVNDILVCMDHYLEECSSITKMHNHMQAQGEAK
ncbi:MAG: hypothetical protein ACMV1B_04800 [Prevotella sp.]